MSGTAPHAVLVLAGGLSRRLGQPKQLLRRHGETLLHRAVRMAHASAAAQVVVVLPAQAETLRAAVDDLPCMLLTNATAERGLASSLRVAAATVQPYPRVLLLACDQPALHPDHLQQLLEGAAQAPSGCAATLHGPHAGVPAVVPGDWFGDTATLADDEGFRTRLRALPADTLWRLHAPGLQRDLDTPADVAAARAAGWLDPA